MIRLSVCRVVYFERYYECRFLFFSVLHRFAYPIESNFLLQITCEMCCHISASYKLSEHIYHSSVNILKENTSNKDIQTEIKTKPSKWSLCNL